MILTFCGHAAFQATKEYEKTILNFLEEKIGDKEAIVYLGGYGAFDDFAYHCCNQYKKTHSNISLVFVTPYITAQYQRNHLDFQQTKYDAILYPAIEDKPLKFAITYRNRYMAEKADCVIAYVSHRWGGAYAMFQYAKKKGKEIFNLANMEDTKMCF